MRSLKVPLYLIVFDFSAACAAFLKACLTFFGFPLLPQVPSIELVLVAINAGSADITKRTKAKYSQKTPDNSHPSIEQVVRNQ